MNIKQFLVKENNNLDFIRIVCASLVIVGHSFRVNPYSGHQDVIEFLTGFTYSGSIAVKIFFFISGMLVTASLMKKQSIKSFTISRFFRVMPGLFFLLVISAMLVGPWVSSFSPGRYFSSSMTYLYIVKNLYFYSTYDLPGVFLNNDLPVIVNASLWTIRYEVGCYIMLAGIFVICRYTIKRYKLIYHVVIAVIFIDAIFNLQIIGRGETTHSLLPMSFALGCLLALNSERVVISYKTVLVSGVLTCLCWRFNLINEILFNTTICLAVIPVSKASWIRKIRIRHDISYGVYLWGFLVQQTLFHFFGRQNVYLFMTYSLIISYVLGYLSFILIEKRFMDIGKRLDGKTNPGGIKSGNNIPDKIADVIR